jgi:hypothetical protein
MRNFTLGLTLLMLGSCAAWAGTVCPGAATGTNFPHPPDPTATGCNVVITVNANGSTTVTAPDSTAYENSEDVIVGVVNNSSGTVSSLSLSGSGIFGFDGDGICTFTFAGSSYCTASQQAGTDPQDYQGPHNTFTVTNANTGTVNFSPAIAPGGTGYFSLEGTPATTIAATATVGPSTGNTASVPALSNWGLALLMAMIAGLSMRMLRRA